MALLKASVLQLQGSAYQVHGAFPMDAMVRAVAPVPRRLTVEAPDPGPLGGPHSCSELHGLSSG